MSDLLKFIPFLDEYPIWVKYYAIILIFLIAFFVVFMIMVPRDKGNLDISSVKIFYVEIEKNMYQIGLVVDVSNLTKKSIAIKYISFEGDKIDLNPRGSVGIPINDEKNSRTIIFTQKEIGQQILGDTPLKVDNNRIYKVLFPMKQEMIIHAGFPFEVVFWGKWSISDINGNRFEFYPRSFGNYEGVLTKNEWDKLVNLDITLKHYSGARYGIEPIKNYILYNSDRTATIDMYGYCTTIYARSKNGAMVIIRGPENPLIPDNWVVLGNTYPEIWLDNQKRDCYNSVFSPDSIGNEIPFCKFSGDNLGTDLASPVTRCADVLEIDVDEALGRTL